MQINSIDFKKNFYLRTKEIFTDPTKIDNYEFTFLINTAIGFLFTIKEASITDKKKLVIDFPVFKDIFSKKLNVSDLPQEFQNENTKLSIYKDNKGKRKVLQLLSKITIENLIRHLRNSIAHLHITPINIKEPDDSSYWSSVIFEDFDNDNEKTMFLYLTRKEFQDVILTLANIVYPYNQEKEKWEN